MEQLALEEYDLELEKVAERIKKENAKLVCVQLPDGLKNKGKVIQDYIKENTDADVIIWAGSCFGACDLPLEVQKLGVDLLVQWGHSIWR
ncbi:diphthamide synthesis protein [Candidatus Woesearchaeota archaeon]|nr:diphthamide synthesis protein [Candidatus Woesearchaeota archaeon]